MDSLYLLYLLFVLLVAEVTTITVKPCPTNKIAPHRRSPRYRQQSKTFGHIYSLFADEDQGNYGGLQEEPQPDDPNDCGDIEDYDENDLSSVTRNEQRKQQNERFFFGPFGHFFGTSHKPTNTVPTKRPEKSTYKPTRPPPGGYFGANPYRPQMHLNPSDHLKPVQEYGLESHVMYKPTLVGVPLGHIVGVPQVKPTRHSLQDRDIHPANSHTIKVTQPTKPHPQKHPNPRNIHDTGLFRSFVDLLF